eukprot:1906610-Pyramimonas_sp.AAC.2
MTGGQQSEGSKRVLSGSAGECRRDTSLWGRMHPLEDIPSSSIAVCSDPVEKPGTRWGPSIKEPEKNWPVHWFFYAWTPSGPRFLYRIRAYCNKQSVGEILLQGSTEDCALRGAHQMDEVKEAWALQLK